MRIPVLFSIELFRVLSLLLSIALIQACAHHAAYKPVTVEIIETEQGYQLMRNGQPYTVRGAGGDLNQLESLARNGGNSIRTWHVETDRQKGIAFLNRAHDAGLTVSLCLNIASERQGFDYNDPEAVARQFEQAKQAVQNYKDHPALLSWIIGNELNYDFSNKSVYDEVNNIAQMIHQLDPDHPATTAIAGFNASMMRIIEERAPELDFISVQMYGDLINLPRYIQETGYTKPYFVSEWGSIGHWEVAQTEWGAPIELTSTEKASNYRRGYEKVIAVNPYQGLGNYVFLWGQKQERTPTWYGVFAETGEETEAVDVMHYFWTGQWPDNRSPAVVDMQLSGRSAIENIYLKPGQVTHASLVASDPDGDPLFYQWGIKHERDSSGHGGDFEQQIADIEGLIHDSTLATVNITAPLEVGPYRIFVYAYDGNGKVAHANIPFFVRQE